MGLTEPEAILAADEMLKPGKLVTAASRQDAYDLCKELRSFNSQRAGEVAIRLARALLVVKGGRTDESPNRRRR